MPSEFQHRPSVIEPLERRRLYSGGTGNTPAAPADGADVAPPAVVGVRILGTPLETTGVAVTYSEPLDVARAQQVGNYRISREHKGDDSGFFSNPFDDGAAGQQTIKLDA